MNVDTFIGQPKQVKMQFVQKQKDFYQNILKQESKEIDVRMHAYFKYAYVCYYDAAFQKLVK